MIRDLTAYKREWGERANPPLVVKYYIFFTWSGEIFLAWEVGIFSCWRRPIIRSIFSSTETEIKIINYCLSECYINEFSSKLILCALWPITFARVCLPRVVLNRAIHSIDARLLMASRNSPLTPSKLWGSKLVCRTHKLNFSFQRWFPGFALHISRSKTRWPPVKRASAETIAGLHVTSWLPYWWSRAKPFLSSGN